MLKRPNSVVDLAMGFLLTKRQAWADDTFGSYSADSSPRSPRARRSAAVAHLEAVSTPLGSHAHLDEVATPIGSHVYAGSPPPSTPAHTPAHTAAHTHAPAALNRLSLAEPGGVPALQLQLPGRVHSPNVGRRPGPKMGLKLPTLDLSAPPADSGLTLMTDHVGSMRRKGLPKKADNEYGDLLDGVDGIIEVGRWALDFFDI